MRRFRHSCAVGLLSAAAACGGVSAGNGAGANASAPAGPYPAEAVLTSFTQSCSELASLPAATAHVEQAGWRRVADPAASPLGAVIAKGEQMVAGANDPGIRMIGILLFEREVAGERLHLMIDGVEGDGIPIITCRIYDVGETRPLAKAAAVRQVGREPAQSTDDPQLTKWTWTPGLSAGQDSFQIAFIPQGSMAETLTGITGTMLMAERTGTAQAVGETR